VPDLAPVTREARSLRDFAALTQSVGDLGAILSDGADRTSVRDALAACLRRLNHIAKNAGVKLDE
jgi:hypothetical protein